MYKIPHSHGNHRLTILSIRIASMIYPDPGADGFSEEITYGSTGAFAAATGASVVAFPLFLQYISANDKHISKFSIHNYVGKISSIVEKDFMLLSFC